MATFTGSINDKKEAWLKEKGYTGTLNDMFLKYYNDQGGTSFLSITDAIRNLLQSSGYSGSINDMYTVFLMDNTSVDGSITDMESQFFSDSTKSFPLLPNAIVSSLGVKSWIQTDDTQTNNIIVTYVVSSSGGLFTLAGTKNIFDMLTTSPPIRMVLDAPSSRAYISGGQLVVETLTWPVSDVNDIVSIINGSSLGLTATTVSLDSVEDGDSANQSGNQLITQINDKSGNNNHALQATSAQQPSIGSGINSKATAVFGASKWLKMLSVSTKNNLLLSICKSTSATFTEYSGLITARSSLSTKTANSTNPAGFTGNATNGNTICNVGQSTVAIYIDGIQVNAVNFDNFAVGVSFVPVLSPHSVIQIDNIASAGTQNFCIGADTFDAVGNRHWPGELLEIIIADNVPSAIQIAGLATYARGRGRTA